ncbi:MAG: hypothetical protein ACKVS6_17340 [Planctomycetota bacterium]
MRPRFMIQSFIKYCTAAIIALSTLGLGSVASAQATPGPRRQEPVVDISNQRRLAATHAGYQSFLTKAGGAWTAQFDEDTGAPALIFGSGIPLGGPVRSIAEGRIAARSVFDTYTELWGSELKHFVPDGEAETGPLFIYNWKQQFDGLDVRGGRIQIQVHKAGRVSAIMATGVAFPASFSRTPALAPEAAEQIVKNLKTIKSNDSIITKDILIFIKGLRGAAEPRVAYRVDVEQPWADVYEKVYVDARDGAILEVEPVRYEIDVKGRVTGFVNTTLSSLGTPVEVPLEGITVSVPGVGSAITDANGDYFISNAGQVGTSVIASITGPFFDVHSAQGSNLVVTETQGGIFTGTITQDFVLNQPATEFNTSQTTAAYHTLLIAKYLDAEIPAFTPFQSMFVQTNISASCNAYYTNDTMNFYASGGACGNTAYSTVVYHEYGHGVDDKFGGIPSGSLSEALADICAMYKTGQAVVGQDFKGPGTIIRTGENATNWPAANCNGEVHCVGQTFMGFAWQSYKKLKTSLGDDAGRERAEALFLGSFVANNTGILNAVNQVFLLDDDDGDITNGTPNYTVLAAAAVMKGFTPPQLKPILISHQSHRDTWNQTQPYPIICEIKFNASTPVFIDLSYTVEGGSPNVVPMVPFGPPNQYIAYIPPVVGPAFIHYSISALDNLFNYETAPFGDSAYRFAIGRKTILLTEDFESGAPGWQHAATLGSNDWEIGVPQSAGTNVYDPKKALSGFNCAGTDLQTTFGSNGIYNNAADRYLQTPLLDSTGHTGVRVRYRRWLTVEGSQFDQAEVLVNNANVYINPYSTSQFDNVWTIQDHAAPAADNTNGFRARWRLKSDSGSAYGGWNIDDVTIYTVEPTPVTTLNLSTNTATPYLGQTFTLFMNGTPNASWELFVALFPGQLTLEGFGTIPISDSYLGWFTNGMLDASGQFTFAFPMPYIPELAGLSFHWVAGAIQPGGDWQISNVLKVTWQ